MSERVGRLPAGLTEQDRAAIRRLDLAYVNGVLTQDWEGITALLTPDAVVMPPNERPVAGRASNLARFRAFNLTSVEYEHVLIDIAGDAHVAYLHGQYSLRMRFPGVAEPYVDSGKYLWVVNTQGGAGWLVHRIMWNSDLPKDAG